MEIIDCSDLISATPDTTVPKQEKKAADHLKPVAHWAAADDKLASR